MFRSVVYWGSRERGYEILDWVRANCASYDNCFGKTIDVSKNFSSLENTNMELWFTDHRDALMCTLRWA
jgi:hypothetical protein